MNDNILKLIHKSSTIEKKRKDIQAQLKECETELKNIQDELQNINTNTEDELQFVRKVLRSKFFVLLNEWSKSIIHNCRMTVGYKVDNPNLILITYYLCPAYKLEFQEFDNQNSTNSMSELTLSELIEDSAVKSKSAND